MIGGWGTYRRSAVIVQRAIEEAGVPNIIMAALFPVARQSGTPGCTASIVPMGANVGETNNVEMQKGIFRDVLIQLVEIQTPGRIMSLPYEHIGEIWGKGGYCEGDK